MLQRTKTDTTRSRRANEPSKDKKRRLALAAADAVKLHEDTTKAQSENKKRLRALRLAQGSEPQRK